MLNVPLIKTCDKYISCYYGHVLLRKCENQQQFNVKTGKCDSAKNVDCVANSCSIHTIDNELVYVPSAASCGNYYICMAGQAKSLTCATGLYFSTKCNCCDRAENVQCLIEDIETQTENIKEKRYFNEYSKQLPSSLQNPPTLVGETTAIKCPPNGHYIYKYIEDSKMYVTCVNGKAALYACASGRQFNDRQKRCVNTEKLEQDTANRRDFNKTELNTESSLIKCPQLGAAIMPHAENNNKYILCANGNATIFECPEQHNSDATANVCRNSLDALRQKRYGAIIGEFAGIVCPKFATFTFPHVQKHKFYLCLDGKANVIACAEGQFFDIAVHDCRDELIQKEEANITPNGNKFETAANPIAVKCPESGNTTLPHVQRNLYYLCIEGNAAVFACANGLLYDAKLKNCAVYNEIYKPALDTETANIMCPKFGTFIYPHAQRNRYYVCIDGNAVGFACAEGQIFYTKTNACQGDKKPMEDNEHQTPVVLDEPTHILCPAIGAMKFAHDQPNKFYLCVNGMASVLACANGSFFDTETGACQKTINTQNMLYEPINSTCPLQGTFKIPHVNRNKFYLCIDGIATTYSCAKGDLFDAETETCYETLFLTNVENIDLNYNVEKEIKSDNILDNSEKNLVPELQLIAEEFPKFILEENNSKTEKILLNNTNEEFNELNLDVVEVKIKSDNVLDNSENNPVSELKSTIF